MTEDYGEVDNVDFGEVSDDEFGEVSNEEFGGDGSLEEKKDNKIWIIIGIILIVLCCCCLVVGVGLYYLWNNGDEIFNLTGQLMNFLL